jgi:hypothetical protein
MALTFQRIGERFRSTRFNSWDMTTLKRVVGDVQTAALLAGIHIDDVRVFIPGT